MKQQNFAKQLIDLKKADLALRNKLIQSNQLGEGYNQEMKEMHEFNSEKLNKIIALIGYPTIEKVGKEASEAAWLVIQHSIGNPVFMKKCAQLLKIETDKNKVDQKNLAYLTDRIAVFEGNPQLYGTQFDWDKNGQLNPNLYDDLNEVNRRRKKIGLNSLEEQTEIMRQRAREEEESAPADFEKRKFEFDEWRKQVGWIGKNESE